MNSELVKAILLLQARCKTTDCDDCEVSHLCIIMMGDGFVTDDVGVMQ